MNICFDELDELECSDECAYHLIRFFHRLALEFENTHLSKAQRHARLIASKYPYDPYDYDHDPYLNWEDDDEMPF